MHDRGDLQVIFEVIVQLFRCNHLCRRMVPQVAPFAVMSEPVGHNNLVPFGAQRRMQVRADKSCATRDQYHARAYMENYNLREGPAAMNERPKFFDDLAGVAGGAISALAGIREELTALARSRVDEAVKRLDLVRRDEFDAIAELAQRAKIQVEALEARIIVLESQKSESPAHDDVTD